MISRRQLIASGIAASLAEFTAEPANAQQRQLHIVVPFSPGTTPDTIARALGPSLQKNLNSAVVVDNRVGASGLIGIRWVMQSNDPGTIQIISSTALMIPMFYKEAGFDMMKTFRPITHLVSSAFALVVNKEVPATNLKEFIAWAKTDPRAFYGSPGTGTHHHLFMVMLLQKLGLNIQHIPYKGFSQAFSDLMGGQIQAMFVPIQIAVPQRNAGLIKIIGSSLLERHPNFPSIPSLNEQGATGYNADPWYGAWGSPKVTSELAQTYRAAFITAMNDPEVKNSLVEAQGLILRSSTPEELQAMAEKESAMWTKVIREANIKPE